MRPRTTAYGRDVFRFLRGATTGRYRVAPNNDLLRDATSASIGALHDEFAVQVDRAVTADCADALQALSQVEDKETQQMLAAMNPVLRAIPVTLEAIHSFAGNETVHSRISALSSQIEQKSNAIANELLAPEPVARLQELSEALHKADLDEDEEDEEDENVEEEHSTEHDALRERARAAKSLVRYIQRMAQNAIDGRSLESRRSLVFRTWMGDRIIPRDRLLEIGRSIKLRKHIRTLEGGARALVFDVPKKYAQYKRSSLEQGKWFRSERVTANTLSPAEVDILLLVMLRHARRALMMLQQEPKWLKRIQERYLMQVLIDEATDFSCVQLATMLELAHPRVRSWLACGDFLQRITREGICTSDDVRWIANVTAVGEIETHEITMDYRQTSKLRALAEGLATRTGEKLASETDEPDLLLQENLSNAETASWLADRIFEVERAVGHLPSVAVFVDGDEQIEPLVTLIAPLLEQRNVRIVGCHDGRVVGNEQEVRVFDIQYIKGLEFEAVFLVGVDGLAARIPDLFERYLYVGVTRAATFLGLTCANRLPAGLEFARLFFATASWH